ncbi:hypothetical protein ACKVWC_007969 [Pyricularia oryzae]
MPGDAGAVSKTLDKFLSKGQLAAELFPPLSLATAARLPAPFFAPVCRCAQGLFVGLLARRLQLLAKSGTPRSWTGSSLAHDWVRWSTVLCAALLSYLEDRLGAA